MSFEEKPSKTDCRRRTIFLAYNPNSTTNSQKLYEWALSNLFRPNLDHVYLFSVLHAHKMYNPVMGNVWTFGLVGYANTYSVASYHVEYQNYIKNEQESTKRMLQTISCELATKNITSNLIIARGNVREELLNTCESIKPDIILIGSSSKSKIHRSKLSHIRNHVKNIPVQSDANDELFRKKNTKNSEPKVPKQRIYRIYRVIQKAMKRINPKSCDIDREPILNRTYHKLED